MMKLLKSVANIILAILLLLTTIWFITSQPLFLTPEKVDTPKVSPNTLQSYVQTLSKELPARFGAERSLEPTINWVEQQIKPYGNSYRQSYQVEGETFHNLILEFGPETEEIIIVGAHYDTAHGYPGADDNASGVAALIELARLLSETSAKNNQAFNSRIQLIFYTLEEPPYFGTENMGSAIHATQLNQKQQKVKIMIALDMIGYFSDEKGSQHFPFPYMDIVYPDQGNFITVIGNLSNMKHVRNVKSSFKSTSDLAVYSINAPAFIQGIDWSDHLNFWNHGYPAIMITDTSFNRNLAYHTEQDTANRLDYKKMAKVTEGLYQAILDYLKQ